MNQKKNRNKDYHSFQHKVVKNSRRVKLTSVRATDNIFISGPVQYEPNNQPLNQPNFIHATTTNHHHSSRSTRNAWGNNTNTNTTNTNTNTTQTNPNPNPNPNPSHTQNPPKNPPKNPLTNPPNQNQNIAQPIPRRDVEFPALTDNTKNNINNPTTKPTKKPSKSSIIEPESSWLQYDDDNAMDNMDIMDDYDSNNNNNTNQTTTQQLPDPQLNKPLQQPPPSPPHNNNNNPDSSQLNNDNNNTTTNRFPSHYNRFNDDTNTTNNYTNQSYSHTRPPYQRRTQNNVINVHPGSYERHNNNGYYEPHAAVLDGFNNKPSRHQTHKKRRYTKYNIKIRKTGRDDSGDIHWSASSKKRFVPNGSIQNFTPEFKPYRRPSYNAFLQAIKDRDKRDDEQLEQFQRDRKYYAKLHSTQHLSRLKQAKLAKEQEKLLQNTKIITTTCTQRAPNQSRSRHLLQQQQLYASQMGLNASLLSTMHRPSPPGIPLQSTAHTQVQTNTSTMDNNLNNLLRNIGVSSTCSNTNTPPIIPFKAQTPTHILSLQQQTLLNNNQQISPNPVTQLTVQNNKNIDKKLCATTAPWTGHWKNMNVGGGGMNVNVQPDSASTTNNSRGTSPLDLSQGNNNNNIGGGGGGVKSHTVTPQSNHQNPPNAPNLNATIPSISLTDVTASIGFRRGSGGGKASAKINLMNLPHTTGVTGNVPIRQFSQRLYQQNQQNRTQQLLQQQQQRQAMLNAQAAQQQAQMSNIWQQNKQQEQYRNRSHNQNQWQAPPVQAQPQPQPQPQPGAPPQGQGQVQATAQQQQSIYAQDFHSGAYGHPSQQGGGGGGGQGGQVRHHNQAWNNQNQNSQYQTYQTQPTSSAQNQWQPTHNQQGNWQYGGQY